MGFFGKIKQMLGIGGIKLVCITPTATFARAGGSISGSAQLTSKSDQHITRLLAKVVELVHTKENGETKTKEFDLGTTVIATDVAMKAGESKNLDFAVAYVGGRTLTDMMQAKGGALGVMGKLGKMATGDKSEFELRVEATVKGSMMAKKSRVSLKPV